MIRYFLYNLILHLAAPFAALYLLCASRHRPLLRRFRPEVPIFNAPPVWIHACSVGETHVARGIIDVLHAQCPDIPILLTLNTLSGLALAQADVSDAHITLAPFDIVWSVRGFLQRVRPRLLVLVETEIWPGLVHESHHMDVAVAVVNARISMTKYDRYRRYKGLMPPLFQLLEFVGAQNETYASRFESLGTPRARIAITGFVKYDTVLAEVDNASREALRKEIGFSDDEPVLIFGCTRPGEEQIAAQCWTRLKDQYPKLRIIIAPRHLERLKDAMAPFADEVVSRRSEGQQEGPNGCARVFFLDTFGELSRFYALSTVAVVGGSFFSGVEGHNPLEPAVLGTPAIFGPHMGCFPDAVAMLLAVNGAIQVQTAEELLPVLRQLLDDPAMRERIGLQGCQAVTQNRGAAERNVAQLIRIMEEKASES